MRRHGLLSKAHRQPADIVVLFTWSPDELAALSPTLAAEPAPHRVVIAVELLLELDWPASRALGGDLIVKGANPVDVEAIIRVL